MALEGSAYLKITEEWLSNKQAIDYSRGWWLGSLKLIASSSSSSSWFATANEHPTQQQQK